MKPYIVIESKGFWGIKELYDNNVECHKHFFNNDHNDYIKYEIWYKGQHRHRENKPALIHYNKDGSIQAVFWFKEGIEIKKTNCMKLKERLNK